MKVCFLGSLINGETLDRIAMQSKVKPSNAPVNFENMLVKGMEAAGIDTTVISLPTVSTYPGGNLFAWGRRREALDFGKTVTWLPCINLMGLKQLCVSVGTYFSLLHWLRKNRNEPDKVIMNYSVYPPYSKATQRLGRRYHAKTCCIVSDLPAYLYHMHDTKGIKNWLNGRMTAGMVKLQGQFDSYILLTEHMAKRMGIENKPSLLLEGFSDDSIFDSLGEVGKNTEKTVMYAGALSKGFNIDKLLEGFSAVEGNCRLWLFGFGDLVDEIRRYEEKDSRIHYFGKVEREELLRHQKAAHLLISVKSPEEDHANYSFPSKILEYMTSGTAVASTVVGGIPKEYFDYIYPIDGATAEDIRQAIEAAFSADESELIAKGDASREYAVQRKNYQVQGQRIAEFLNDLKGRKE